MSTESGRHAEQVAAEYLTQQGFTVLDQNWRTRWCEIDLVVRRGDVVYFVEAKHRTKTNFGSGFDYITPKKLRQMSFAAEFWLSRYATQNDDYFLAAIELTGHPPAVSRWVADIG